MEKQQEQKKNKPIRKYRKEGLEVSVWENTTKDNKSFMTYSFQRSYKDKEDKWCNTQSLRFSDLSALASLLTRVDITESMQIRDSEAENSNNSE